MEKTVEKGKEKSKEKSKEKTREKGGQRKASARFALTQSLNSECRGGTHVSALIRVDTLVNPYGSIELFPSLLGERG